MERIPIKGKFKVTKHLMSVTIIQCNNKYARKSEVNETYRKETPYNIVCSLRGICCKLGKQTDVYKAEPAGDISCKNSSH